MFEICGDSKAKTAIIHRERASEYCRKILAIRIKLGFTSFAARGSVILCSRKILSNNIRAECHVIGHSRDPKKNKNGWVVLDNQKKRRYKGIKPVEGDRSCDSASSQSKLTMQLSNSQSHFQSFVNQFHFFVHSSTVEQSKSKMSLSLNE